MPEKVPCSSTERIMDMTGDSEASDRQGRVLVFLKGRLDEETLERAVRLTMDAEPSLRYRFVSDPWRSYWKRARSEEQAEPFRMLSGPPNDRRFYDFLVETIPSDRAPLFRVGLFRSEDDVLCLKVNHMVMDGGGAFAYLSLLSSTYRALVVDPSYRPEVNRGWRDGPRDVLKNGNVLDAVKALPKVGIHGSSWGVPSTGDDRSGRAFMVRQLGPERFDELRAYARSRNVTINDVLLTSFYRALFALVDPPPETPLRIEVPISLRKYLPDSRKAAIGNLAGVFFPTIDRRDGERFEETLVQVHRAVEEMKGRKEELAEMLFIELVLLPGMFLIRGMAKLADFEIAHPGLSNLGVVDPAAVDFNIPVEDVQTLGPVHYPPNVVMGVNTFRGRMTMSFTYCDTAVATRTMDQLFDMFMAELPVTPGPSAPFGDIYTNGLLTSGTVGLERSEQGRKGD